MRLRDRLSYKQVRYTVSVAFILGLVFSAFQVTHDYKTQDKSIDNAIEAYLHGKNMNLEIAEAHENYSLQKI